MSHVVAKEFKTVNRIMKVGMPVAPGDHLEPHDFDLMKKSGFISGPPAVQSAVQAVVEGPASGVVQPEPGDA